MSKIDDLIKKYCPNGVEWVGFLSVCNYIRGITYNKNDEINNGAEGIGVFRANNITLDSNTLNFDDVKVVSRDVRVKESQWLKKGDILICAGSGSKEHIGKVAFIFNDLNFTFGGFMGVIRPKQGNVNPNFLFHIMTSQMFKVHLAKASGAASSTINNINNDTWKGFQIPVPPLEVQREIVQVLDSFTMLTAELSAELSARKKQYEYYRDQLLSFNNVRGGVTFANPESVRWMTLGEIGTFERGRRFVHADDRDEGIPCIHYGELYTHYGIWADKVKTHINPDITTKLRYAEKGDVVIVAAGENNTDIGVGVAWLGNEKVAVHDACFIFRHKQNPKYISYLLRTNGYHQEIKKHVSEGKICSISAEGLAKAKFPVPPIEIQNRIVKVLDNFDSICSDLQIGLPAEIDARKKQYEYYRDLLLSFEPIGTVLAKQASKQASKQ